MNYFSSISLALLMQCAIFTPIFAESVVNASESSFSSSILEKLKLDLALSEANSPRVRYLNNPPRLVLDFDALSFGDLPLDFGNDVSGIEHVNHGRTSTGARMVLTLSRPYQLKSLVSSPIALDGTTGLRVILEKCDDETFASLAQSLGYKGNDLGYKKTPVAIGDKELPLIVIDPGHGGVDPGAVRAQISEKNITLDAARIFANVLLRSDRYQVALTRDEDVFVSLINRRRIGAQLGADLFLSIHADTVEVGDAQGSTIYLLSKSATSENAEKFAVFENRVDLFAGEYLEGDIADLTNVLTDLAQESSLERARHFAELFRYGWSQSDMPRSMKIESAAFAVLKAPEVPSLLLELGYLSNANDRETLQDQEWLDQTGASLLAALDELFYPE